MKNNPFGLWLAKNSIRPAWAAKALGIGQSTLLAWASDFRQPTIDTMMRIFDFTDGQVRPDDFGGRDEMLPQGPDNEAGALLLRHIEEFNNAPTEEDKRTARYKLRHPEGQTRPASKGKERIAGNGTASRA